jgi:hypothetical protein
LTEVERKWPPAAVALGSLLHDCYMGGFGPRLLARADLTTGNLVRGDALSEADPS